jgi:hypothetical protein
MKIEISSGKVFLFIIPFMYSTEGEGIIHANFKTRNNNGIFTHNLYDRKQDNIKYKMRNYD